MTETRSRTALLTAAALIAFAANSVLGRMALGAQLIDPIGFTLVRLLAGTLVLTVLARWTEPAATTARTWQGPLWLFKYALCFSLAYVSLDTGTGALVLFGAVQTTMIGAGLWAGERPSPWELAGGAAAVVGLVVLVAPGVHAPDPFGALMMLGAGVAWGLYSLAGRGQISPVTATLHNFSGALLLALPIAVLAFARGWLSAEPMGLALAACSGGLASGLGYALWYKALRGHSATSAALVQLAVPVLAAGGGVLWLSEQISARLVLSAVLTLGGLAVAAQKRPVM